MLYWLFGDWNFNVPCISVVFHFSKGLGGNISQISWRKRHHLCFNVFFVFLSVKTVKIFVCIHIESVFNLKNRKKCEIVRARSVFQKNKQVWKEAIKWKKGRQTSRVAPCCFWLENLEKALFSDFHLKISLKYKPECFQKRPELFWASV